MTSRDRPAARGRRSAFTLVELLVTISIVVIVLGMATSSFKRLFNSNSIQTAVNTLVTQAAAARAYAIDNQVETMLLVNPYNGRLELWHLNSPPAGGTWDPLSSGSANVANPANVNGVAYAPVLDSTVSLPIDNTTKKPIAVVHPIDYAATVDASGTRLRSLLADANGVNLDNLTWVMLCFDSSGRMVQRMRRIATRVETVNPATGLGTLQDQFGRLSNRHPAPPAGDAAPDTGRVPWLSPSVAPANQYAVDVNDTLITSCLGFVVSDRAAYDPVAGTPPTPLTIAGLNGWLDTAKPGGKNQAFAQWVHLNPYSGKPMAAVE